VTGLSQFFVARIGSGWVSYLWFGFGNGKFHLKMSNFSIFSLWVKKYLWVGSKSTRVKGRLASYLLGSGPICNSNPQPSDFLPSAMTIRPLRLEMGPWPRSGHFFVIRFGWATSGFGKFPLKIPTFSNFFPLGQKNLIRSDQKVPGSKTVRPLVYCRSKVGILWILAPDRTNAHLTSCTWFTQHFNLKNWLYVSMFLFMYLWVLRVFIMNDIFPNAVFPKSNKK